MNKSWRKHHTRHKLYGHLSPITKNIQARQTRHARHWWRSRDELISDVLLWTPAYGQAKAGRPARTYIQQLCEDTGCSPEDLPEAINDGEKWRERVRDIRASGMTWWGWWWCSKISHRKMIISTGDSDNLWKKKKKEMNPLSFLLKLRIGQVPQFKCSQEHCVIFSCFPKLKTHFTVKKIYGCDKHLKELDGEVSHHVKRGIFLEIFLPIKNSLELVF